MGTIIFLMLVAELALQGLPLLRAVDLLKQAKLETANFTSRIYREDNNLFGMRPNSRNIFIGVDDTPNGKFCVYDSLFDSVRDRIALDIQNGVAAVNGKQYMEEVLDNGYVPSGQRFAYLERWKKINANEAALTLLGGVTLLVLNDKDS